MRFLFVGVMASICLSVPSAKAAEEPALTRLLSAAVARFPGKMTAYVKHLPSGREASVAQDEPMHALSVIKLAVLAKAYEMAEKGVLDLDARVVLKSSDLRGGSGIFQYHAPGLNPTIRDLLIQMVITSDNTATDMVLMRVGGVDELNRWLADRGFKMRMHFTMNSAFALTATALTPLAKGLPENELNAAFVSQRSGELTPSGKAAAQELGKLENWLGFCERIKDPSLWLGTTSANDMGRLLEQMETAKLASKAGSEEMMDMLKGQQAGARRIPMYIDQEYTIGHKTGDFPPCAANDVGVVYLRSGPTIMVFLSDQIRGNYGEAEVRIGEIARTVAEYFDGK